jgi:hypothetical protein
MESLTKQDLLDALKDVARKPDLKDVARTRDLAGLATASDLASLEQKVDAIEQRIADLPTRTELGELFKKFYEAGGINTRLERIEKHLGLDVIRVE